MADASPVDSHPDIPKSPEEAVQMLIDLLDVGQVEENRWRGMRKPGGVGRVFGGQVIGQAMMAATRTVPPERSAHSLHAYFMRPGSEDFPIDFRVEADFEGRSFSNRRVLALQNDKPILNLTMSFHRPERGMEHQVPMPDVPMPEELPTQEQLWAGNEDRIPVNARRAMNIHSPIELRPVGEPVMLRRAPADPISHVWFKVRRPMSGVSQAVHRAALAYASDLSLLATAFLPHKTSPMDVRMESASLDHAVWFHEDIAADEWLLHATDSPWTGGARAFTRGQIFTREGKLVASTAQEGLIRLHAPDAA